MAADVDKLLAPKSLEELKKLEKQIGDKLQSNEAMVDFEFMEQCRRRIAVYKAKAELDQMYSSIVESRVSQIRHEQQRKAEIAIATLSNEIAETVAHSSSSIHAKPTTALDSEPQLKLRPEDKALDVIKEQDFLNRIVR